MKHNALWLKRILVLTALPVVTAAMLAACALETLPATAEPDALAERGTAASTAAPEVEASMDTGTVESLDVGTQQSTFLSHIDSAIREMGAPDGHYFVEVTTPGGAVWQGERLSYAGEEVVFLQMAAGDGLTAVRLELPSGADEDEMRALLPENDAPTGDQPNVVVHFVRARMSGSGDSAAWSFDVTVEHPDTGWEDYADGWHVESIGGQILGTRILLHPHVGEQPFTRGLNNVLLPEGISEIRIRPHDIVSGHGSATDPISLAEAATGDAFEVVR